MDGNKVESQEDLLDEIFKLSREIYEKSKHHKYYYIPIKETKMRAVIRDKNTELFLGKTGGYSGNFHWYPNLQNADVLTEIGCKRRIKAMQKYNRFNTKDYEIVLVEIRIIEVKNE